MPTTISYLISITRADNEISSERRGWEPLGSSQLETTTRRCGGGGRIRSGVCPILCSHCPGRQVHWTLVIANFWHHHPVHLKSFSVTAVPMMWETRPGWICQWNDHRGDLVRIIVINDMDVISSGWSSVLKDNADNWCAHHLVLMREWMIEVNMKPFLGDSFKCTSCDHHRHYWGSFCEFSRVGNKTEFLSIQAHPLLYIPSAD